MPNMISFKSNYIVNKKSDIQYNSVKMSLSVLSQNGQENEQLEKDKSRRDAVAVKTAH